MTKRHCFLALLLASFAWQSTDAQDFKRVPERVQDSPDWAQMMYAPAPNFHEVVALRQAYWAEHPYEKTLDERNFKHWLMQVEHRVDDAGMIIEAGDWAAQEFARTGGVAGQIQRAAAAATDPNWHAIGPMDTFTLGSEGNEAVSWQCNAYCFDQSASNPDVVVAGIEAGDLFKSTDRGLNWLPITANLGVRTVTQVSFAPSDASRIYMTASNTLYKTENGGTTWDLMHDLNGGSTQITVHPTDPNNLFISSYNGLQHSTDGGQSWTTPIAGTVWDLAFHPTDPGVLYALKSNGPINRCELFRSDDGGATFAIKESGYYYPEVPSEANDGGGRIGVTPAAPDYVYVALIGKSKAEDTGWIGLWRSTDRGENWSNENGQIGGPYDDDTHPSIATSNANGTGIYQGFYDFDMDVSHNDPDRVWVGVMSLSVTNDGGATWQRIGGYGASTYDIGWVHPDVQAITITGDDIWVTTDGGVNYSNDELATHSSRKHGIYNTTFWGFGQGWNKDVQVGGRYHNGNTGFHQAYATGIGTGSHLRLGGAESPTGYVDPMNDRLVHFSDITDVLLPETAGGATVGMGNLGLYPNQSYSDSRSSELVRDPLYSTYMYCGNGSSFWKSTDGGASFQSLHDFGSGRSVLEIEQARDDRNRFYAVVLNGGQCQLFRSTDGGLSWALSPGAPATWNKMEIALNPTDGLDIWIVHADSDDLRHSPNGGDSWANLTSGTGPLTGHDIRDIQCIGGAGVVVITKTGCFHRATGTNSWTDFGSGMPALWAPYEAFPFYRDALLRVADKGKGVWEADFPFSVPPAAQAITKSPQIFCASDSVSFDCHSLLVHAGASWEWAFSPAPAYISSSTDRDPVVVFGSGGSYDVTLTVTDASGASSTQTVPAMVTVGPNSNCTASPVSGEALYCSGNTAHGITQDLDITTNHLTAMAWVHPDGIQGGYTGIVLDASESAGFNFRENNEIGYHWPGGQWWWTSGLVAPAGQWSHVAMVLTPAGVTIYVNGEAASQNFTATEVQLHTQLIGSYKNWGGRNMNGRIDEVKIWNRALSMGEIREQRHINLSAAEAESDPDLLSYFQFNEEIYYLVNKKSGQGNGMFSGGSMRVLSEAPVGAGARDRFDLNGAGLYPTPNCGGSIETAAGGSTPGGEVVFNRLDLAPAGPPEDHVDGSGYWIVNTYGSAGAEAAISPIEAWNLATDASALAGFAGGAGELTLQRRSSHSSNAGEWTPLCSGPGQVSASSGSVATVTSSCGLAATGQFTLSGAPGCPGDINGDLLVGVIDVLAYLSSFGCIDDCGIADINGDGIVNTTDLLLVLSLFGETCPG